MGGATTGYRESGLVQGQFSASVLLFTSGSTILKAASRDFLQYDVIWCSC